MKKPAMMKSGKGKMERPQGKPKGRASGVNKAVTKQSIPQVVARNTQGIPTQRQKM
jgi:hypothetical protein